MELQEGSVGSIHSHSMMQPQNVFWPGGPQGYPQGAMQPPSQFVPYPAPQPILGMPPYPQVGARPQRVPGFPATPTANNGGDHARALPGADPPVALAPVVQQYSGIGDPRDYPEPTMGKLLRDAAVLFLVYLPFYLIYILLFTEIGFGATFFKGLAESATWWEVVVAIGFFLFLALYVLDMPRWKNEGSRRIVRLFLLAIVIFACAVSVALTFSTRPYAPMLSFLVGMVVVFALVHGVLFQRGNLADFLESLGIALILWGLTGFAVALIWSAANNFWWGPDSQVEFRERLRICEDMSVAGDGSSWCKRYGRYGTRCPAGCAEREEVSACAAEEEDCLAALILWVNPFIMSLTTLLIGASMHFIASQDKFGNHQPTKQNARIFLITLLLFIFIIWIAAAVAGGSGEVSNMVMAFAGTGLLVMFALLARIVGLGAAGQKLISTPLYTRIMGWGRSDWLRGAMVLSISILAPPFLALSWVNKRVRVLLSQERAPAEPDPLSNTPAKVWRHALTEHEMTLDERELTFTVRAHALIFEACTWNWTSVLAKANTLGFAYFILQVMVGKVTTLFLAWLNIQLADVNIWGVSVIIFLIGLALFAIPAVPGVPAYLACGVIIGARGAVEGWSFAGTMLWAILVAWLCKHVACLMQQKLFGEQLGNSLWVRSTLMVNSEVMKAIKIILAEPRFTLNKVYILVGGPDWPTSVMTGVLRLPVLPMQLGTTPIVLPIALTVVAGGGMLRAGEGEVWVSLSSLFLTLSAASFAGTLLIGLVAVENVKTSQAEAIAAVENDKEVEEFDKKQEEEALIREAVSGWADQGLVWQCLLVSSVLCMYLATYILVLAGSECFEEIEVTTDYRAPPINSDFAKFIKTPMGYLALVLEALALLLWQGFNRQLNARVAAKKALLAQQASAPQGGELTMTDVTGVTGAMRSELARTVGAQGGMRMSGRV